MTTPAWRAAPVAGLLLLAQAAQAAPCTVSVLNRTAEWRYGPWLIASVPSSFGQVRLRATCERNGVTEFGASTLFRLTADGVTEPPEIEFNTPLPPIPERLRLTAPAQALDHSEATAQLVVQATDPDGSTRDLTASASGTNYTISNPAIATVSPDGLVTAVSSGTVLITAMNDGASGMIRLQVVTSSDSDGDGIPDDVELANGMNPNDLVDAVEDFDRDGLTNRDEIAQGTGLRNPDTDADGLLDGREGERGTDPLVVDTDGDGLSDGLEVQTGSDPLDPTSFNLGQALLSITASPGSLLITYNTVTGEASRRLSVTGTLLDGRSIDLTPVSRGTNYASADLSIANFGGADGEVFAGLDGTTTITISNSGHTAIVPVTVAAFAPRVITTFPMPAFGVRDVAAAGDFVFAGTDQGLVSISVTDRAAPSVVSTLPASATNSAFDRVVVSGSVAVGSVYRGFSTVDISEAASPRLLGFTELPSGVLDLELVGTTLFTAGAGGFHIFDLSVPSSPRLLGHLPPGTRAYGGLGVKGHRAAVTDYFSVNFIDVSDLSNPQLKGSQAFPAAASDVIMGDRYAFVVAGTGSRPVDAQDLSTPTIPASAGSFLAGALIARPAVAGPFIFAIDSFFTSRISIIDFSDPPNLQFRAQMSYPGAGPGGVAADGEYAYWSRAGGQFFVGQYLSIDDPQGVSPTISFTENLGAESMVGRAHFLVASATDDIGVRRVTFLANGVPFAMDDVTPFEAIFLASAPGEVEITAFAEDYGGNRSIAAVGPTFVVAPDPPPVVSLDPLPPPTEGATVPLAASAADNTRVRSVRFYINGQRLTTRVSDGSFVDEDTIAPYSMPFAIAPGVTSFDVVVEALDNLGQSTVAPAVNVPVQADPPPSVELTSPIAGVPLTEGATVGLVANASDNVRVAFVRFLVEGTVVGSDVAAPFVVPYVIPVGQTSLSIVAEAADNLGRTTLSAPVTVSIVPDPPPVVAIESPGEGVVLLHPSRPQFNIRFSDNGGVARLQVFANGVQTPGANEEWATSAHEERATLETWRAPLIGARQPFPRP